MLFLFKNFKPTTDHGLDFTYKPLQLRAYCDLDWVRDPKLGFPASQEIARGI